MPPSSACVDGRWRVLQDDLLLGPAKLKDWDAVGTNTRPQHHKSCPSAPVLSVPVHSCTAHVIQTDTRDPLLPPPSPLTPRTPPHPHHQCNAGLRLLRGRRENAALEAQVGGHDHRGAQGGRAVGRVERQRRRRARGLTGAVINRLRICT